MTLPVFLADPADAPGGETLRDGSGNPVALAELKVGDTALFSGPEAEHARGAFRLKTGDYLQLVDGAGTRATTVVTAAASTGKATTSLELRVEDVEGTPSVEFQVWLVQALAKQGRDEQAVESAVELGVDRVVPWQSQRSIVRWVPAKAAKAHQKWVNLVRKATKQSRRSRLAPVDDLHSSEEMRQLTEQIVAAGGLVLLCDETAAMPLPAAVDNWLEAGSPSGSPVVIIVGPEGGITPEEHDWFVSAGAQAVILGPEVMRSSTAGPAALVALNYHLGRWPRK